MNISKSNETSDFLRRVRLGISSLPVAEQEDFVAELRSHIMEKQARGESNPLQGFESPEQLAADLMAEYALRGALATGTSWAMARALRVAARDSLLGLLVLLPLVVLQLSGLLLIVAAVLKPFLPDITGVWLGPGQFFAGIVAGNRTSLHEVLGWWAIPVFAILGVLLYWISNRAMKFLVPWRLVRSRRPSFKLVCA